MSPTRRGFVRLSALGLLPRLTRAGVVLPLSLPVTRILFGGDVMLSRYVGIVARAKGDPGWPLRDVSVLLSSADIAFANLESPFSDRGRVVEKGMVFKAEPEMIQALLQAGINIVSTANNHARDCGRYGVEYTLDWLEQHGIAAVGTAPTSEAARRGTVIGRNGVRFGFLAYTYDQSNGNHADLDERIAMMDTAQVTEDVKGLLERADAVVVSMHAGNEYQRKPNVQQQKFARAAIDAGASVVVGHHPHVTQPMESYGGGVIFYSLGNLVFDQFQQKDTQRGWIADVRFVGKRLAEYNVIPVDIVRTAPRASLEP
ncbi:MAG TPA: CapA family protein [Bryobacteraceae bacterium]|nr:CapA family protein [Bryobacteraceae bacterium]